MSSQPKVSILIPCYNAERWVAAAIQSALDQTHENKEVVVVDDGSTDGSLEVIRSFEDKIRWETGPNRGGNVARNRLLELSTGDWLQYLDADDYLMPQKITNQLATESSASSDLIYSPVTIETWFENTICDTAASTVSIDCPIEVQWLRWQIGQTGVMLWKRSSLLAIGGWNTDFPCCQDNEVTHRAITKGLKFTYCPKAEAVYRIWSAGTVCHKSPNKVVEVRTWLMDSMMEWMKDNGRLSGEAVRAAGQSFFEMARMLARTNLSEATIFAEDRRKRGQLRATGPAAPLRYRLVYSCLGFKLAESIARLFRG